MVKALTEEISDIFTPEGAKKVKVGQVLVFDYEGSKTHLKITKKALGRIWAKHINLLRMDEVSIMDRKTGQVL